MQRALVLALDGKLTKEAYKYKVLTDADHHHRLFAYGLVPDVPLDCRCLTCWPGLAQC